MDVTERARAALRPMIDQGIVTHVELGTFFSHNLSARIGRPIPVRVFVNDDDPEKHRSEIERLLEATPEIYEVKLGSSR